MIKVITNRLKSIAVLEAIICPEWEYRYFSYDSQWGEGEEMASMRDGSGDEWFLWVKNDLAAIKTISHELGVLENIDSVTSQFPDSYKPFITEPAFSIDQSSSLWYLAESNWVKFDLNEKVANKLIEVFTWTASDYKEWADDYYEEKFSLKAIESVIAGTITDDVIRLLNNELTSKDLEDEINAIGYNR